MQLMVIEYARNVVGLKGAHTAEVDQKAPHVVVDIMPEQKEKLAKKDYGATMRLGQYEARIKPDTQAEVAYKTKKVLERHRHRYEINPEYIERIMSKGLVFSGTSPDGRLMEIAELPKSVHPFFLATQFHPEFQSSLLHPHLLLLHHILVLLSLSSFHPSYSNPQHFFGIQFLRQFLISNRIITIVVHH